MNWTERRARMRAILAGEACVHPGSVFDPISARIAEDLGFEVGMFAGSVASMAVLGAPDLILLTLSEFAEQAYRICRAGNLALLVDSDHGYGNALNVKRTVEELETAVNTKPKSKGELEEWADELERESFQIAQERRMMEADRKQLREDESSLEKQMREMEVQMARERAMLARQEQELKRLNAEIQHELEVMQRGDGTLRERLAVFQRRHAEVIGGAPPPPQASYYGQQHIPEAEVATVTPPPRKTDSNSLLRKLFRSGD